MNTSPPPLPSHRVRFRPREFIAAVAIGLLAALGIWLARQMPRPAAQQTSAPSPTPWVQPVADSFTSAEGRLWIGTVLYQHGKEVGTIRAIEDRVVDGRKKPMVLIHFNGSDLPPEWKTRAVVTQYFQVRSHQLR